MMKEKKISESIIDSLPGIFYQFRTDGTFVRWNKQFEKVTGYSTEEMKQINAIDLFLGEDQKTIGEAMQKVFIEGEAFAEASIITKKGESIPYLFKGRLFYIDQVPYLIGMGIDITSRKQAEEKIEYLLNEKEILLREVHHRIKNNMASLESLIRLHIRVIKSPEAISALQDTMSRLKSMRILYDKLYRSDKFGEVSMKPYLTHLVDDILSIFTNKDFVVIEKEIEDFIVGTDITFSLGIIINELITNSMKYAFENEGNNIITIRASQKEGKAIIVVQDNGVGIQGDLNLKSTAGFGLQLVEMLVAQIHGSVNFLSENGTKVILEFDV